MNASPLQPDITLHLTETNNDCIKLLNLQGKLIYMNQGGQQAMEIDDFSSCLLNPWLDFWSGKEKEEAHEALNAAIDGRVATFEAFCPTLKGTPKWWNVTVSPIYNDSGEIKNILSISRDITAQRKTQLERDELMKQLETEHKRLELAQAAGHIGTFEWDLINDTMIWSDETWALYGLTSDDINAPAPDWISMVHPADRPEIEKFRQRALLSDGKLHGTFRVIWPSESIHWLQFNAQVLIDEQTQSRRMIGVQQDVSEQKALEQRKDSFIGLAGHELRTPLTSIKGNAQLAQRQLKRLKKQTDNAASNEIIEKLETFLERIERLTAVQNRLVSDLLDVSRIQTDKLDLQLEPANIVQAVRDATADIQQTNPDRSITLELPAEESIIITIDANRIQQVLGNYLTNALKFSEADKPIKVQLVHLKDSVRVCVQDEGPGLSQLEQQQVWERFHQSPDIRLQPGATKGLGLGLYICQTIIQQSGGQIGVKSKKGHGSTFWFSLPLNHTI